MMSNNPLPNQNLNPNSLNPQNESLAQRSQVAPPPGSGLPAISGALPSAVIVNAPVSSITSLNNPGSQSGTAAWPKVQSATTTKAAQPKVSPPNPPNRHSEKTKFTSASSNRGSGAGANSAIVFNAPQQNQLLAQCDYKDKTIWATRLLLGGNSVNGFLRSTATVQRIKKQRARQNNSTKQSRAAAAAKASNGDPVAAAAAAAAAAVAAASVDKVVKPTSGAFDQAEEEQLKKEIMNPRTAKKLKTELEQGLAFCATVCNVLRGVLFDIDTSLASSLPPALIIEQPKPPAKFTFLVPSDPVAAANHSAQQQRKQDSTAAGSNLDAATVNQASINPNVSGASSHGIAPATVATSSKPVKTQQQPVEQETSTASPGGPESSTLRKFRKNKKPLPPGPSVDFPEFDVSGKRSSTKKEYHYRLFTLMRYRPLKKGDFCAARLSSRDLWILAKVLKDYPMGPTSPPQNLKPMEFLQLTDAKREAMFREKVLLQDVEEGDDSGATVTRNLVLPLPRNALEASEWTTRLRKGSRIYAMYPQTTSLYAATVVDCTTYCRGDDDIIVVEFDGEEIDTATGKVPTYHIPARFVTLIPREFPASQIAAKVGGTQSVKRKTVATSAGSISNKKRSSTASRPGEYLGMVSQPMDFGGNAGLGFDALDLDFDKPLDDVEQKEQFPPF